MLYFILVVILSIKLILLAAGLSSGFSILATALSFEKRWLRIMGQIFAWFLLAYTLFMWLVIDISIFNILRNNENFMHNCPFRNDKPQSKNIPQDMTPCPYGPKQPK